MIEPRGSSSTLCNSVNINDNEVLIHNKSTAFKSLTINLQQANMPLLVIFMPLRVTNDKYSTNIKFKREYHQILFFLFCDK